MTRVSFDLKSLLFSQFYDKTSTWPDVCGYFMVINVAKMLYINNSLHSFFFFFQTHSPFLSYSVIL